MEVISFNRSHSSLTANILLFLWSQASGPPGTFDGFYRFGPRDVMRLAAQIRANLRMPHRLTVVTDLPRHQFCAEIEHLDLVQHFGELRQFGGCWLRLKCFAPELEPVLGPRWAWIDLDCLVVGALDPLLDRPEPLVLYRSDSVIGQHWNGSFVLGGSGSGDIWTKFDPVAAPPWSSRPVPTDAATATPAWAAPGAPIRRGCTCVAISVRLTSASAMACSTGGRGNIRRCPPTLGW